MGDVLRNPPVSGHRLSRRGLFAAGAAAGTAVFLAAPRGAAAARRADDRERWRVEVPGELQSELAAGDGSVYLTRNNGIESYRRTDGASRWQHDIPTPPKIEMVRMSAGGGYLAYVRYQPKISHIGGPKAVDIEVLTAAAGAVRWREQVRTRIGRDVLIQGDSLLLPDHAACSGRSWTNVRRLIDGGSFWTAESEDLVRDGAPDVTTRALFTGEHDGVELLTLRNLASGDAVWTQPASADGRLQHGWDRGDHYIGLEVWNPVTLVRFDAATGATQWRRPLEPHRPRSAPVFEASRCAAGYTPARQALRLGNIGVFRWDDVAAVDLDRGTLLWHRDFGMHTGYQVFATRTQLHLLGYVDQVFSVISLRAADGGLVAPPIPAAQGASITTDDDHLYAWQNGALTAYCTE